MASNEGYCEKLFTMGTSIADLERKFSTMGFINTKLRNRFSTTSMEKLVYINTNMGVLYDSSHESSQRTEEDEVISDDEPCIVIEN